MADLIKFNRLWTELTELYDWAKPVANDYYRAYCTVCKASLAIRYSGKIALSMHGETRKHRRNLKRQIQMEKRGTQLKDGTDYHSDQSDSSDEDESQSDSSDEDESHSKSSGLFENTVSNSENSDQDEDQLKQKDQGEEPSNQPDQSSVHYSSSSIKSPRGDTVVKLSKFQESHDKGITISKVYSLNNLEKPIRRLAALAKLNHLSCNEETELPTLVAERSPSPTVGENPSDASTLSMHNPIDTTIKSAPKKRGRKRKNPESHSSQVSHLLPSTKRCSTIEPKQGNDVISRVHKILQRCETAKESYEAMCKEGAKEIADILAQSKEQSNYSFMAPHLENCISHSQMAPLFLSVMSNMHSSTTKDK